MIPICGVYGSLFNRTEHLTAYRSRMYQLTRLEYTTYKIMFEGHNEDVLIELYIDYRTNKKYILNKIDCEKYAYVKEYMFDELQYDDTVSHMIPYDENDETIYGKNPNLYGSWRIDSDNNRTDYLTECNIQRNC
jgi:hypothetical protein